MSEQTGVAKLLVLHGPALERGGIVDFFREHFQVEVVMDLDQALDLMRRSRFDAVLAETADFLPLERGVVSHRASAVLDTIGDGVCLAGPNGQLVWANRRLAEYPPTILDPLRELCAKAYAEFAADSRRDADQRGRRFSLMPEGSSYFEVICSPVRDRGGQLQQIVAVVVNATSQRRQQLKLNAIDKAGRELVRLEDDPTCQRDAAGRLSLLEERILRYSRDVLDYQHFALLLLDKQTNRLEMLVSQGLDEAAEKYQLFCTPEGNGISGYVASTGRSYICPDVSADQRYLKGLINARSSLTVPLRLHDKVIGVLNVESDKVGAFGEEDRQFAEIFANYIAVALHMLHLLVSERYTAHTQLSGSIVCDLSGPLNDMITDASELMEDYIGHDDVRKRLGALIDKATEARKLVQQYAAPSSGVLASPAEPVRHDPVLSGKVVLVADDEELIRNTVRDVLCPYGCTVDVANDGAQAAAMIRQRRYDLVISDIKMPGATGYEVFAAAKDACPQTGVILITAFGYDPHHSIVKARGKGLSAVLMKPFKVKQLLEECRCALSPKSI